MKRSIWSETADLPTFEPLRGDVTTDVLIIGGGMAGILCAYLLHQAGVDYVLVEASRICSGITKNTTAKLTSQHGLIYHKLLNRFGIEQAKFYLEANESALAQYRRLCESIPCGFEEQDNYVYALGSRKKLDREMTALSFLGAPAEFVSDLSLPFSTAGAVRFPQQAQFHPLRFVSGITKGLHIHEHTVVRELIGTTAVTSHGNIKAEKIIVATHFPFLNKHGSYFLKLYQQRSYVLALENAPAMEGMYLDQAENGLSFRSHNGTLLLGGGGHRTGKQGGSWLELEAFAAKYYPGAAITHRWATQDCITLDEIPYIGQYSARTPNLYVATGFNKWGMTSSMVAAQLLADLIQGKDNPYTEVFSPSRSILHPQLGLNALESTKNLLSISPKRCPHLGCELTWNNAEKSWDCPCHGSRYDYRGKLLDGPAQTSLSAIRL